MAYSTDIISSLGAGSGIDIQGLAKDLANAEVQPRIDQINTKISQSEAKISAYGYIKTALLDLQTAFKKLDDASDFASISPSVSQPNAVGVTTNANAQTGTYGLNISQVATAQSIASSGFAARDTLINSGAAFTLNLGMANGTSQTISVATATPAGMVSAINSANADIQAQLINTGDATTPYKIVVTGQTGASNSFTLSALDGSNSDIVDGLGNKIFDTSNPTDTTRFLQNAQDAQFSINGLSVSRASNQVDDLIDGVTFQLYAATSGTASVELNRQTQEITESLRNLVNVYNDLELTLSELGNPSSEIEVVGGALNNNSILQTVRSTVRAYITNNASTPSGGVRAARDVGLSFDRKGQLTLNEDKLATALQNNFDDVVHAFSAGTSGKSIYSPSPAGIAGDAVVKLDRMLRTTGIISTQADNASQKVADYKDELAKLDDRLQQILTRYTQQFSVMESIVGNTRSLQTSLKSTFDGMMATYTNKG
jgi:flagellar hook-associated protein 2